MIQFSIIVPVYKVEQYLPKCIESILAQNYPYFELLLIDDGSPDKCPVICDEYALHDSRVKVIHKSNGGLSDARNKGIQVAKGDYLVFIDSDDWIERDALDGIAKAIIQYKYPDIIETSLIEAFPEKNIIHDENIVEYIKSEGFQKKAAVQWIMNFAYDTWPAQQKIVKTSLIANNNLRFAEGRLHEDNDWTPRICYAATTFGAYTRPWYYHRLNREGAITASVKAKNITDVIEMAVEQKKIYDKQSDETSEVIFVRIMGSVFSSINKIKYCTDKDKELVQKCVENNIELFSYTSVFKYKIFYYSLLLLGTKRTLYLLSKI